MEEERKDRRRGKRTEHSEKKDEVEEEEQKRVTGHLVVEPGTNIHGVLPIRASLDETLERHQAAW